MKIDVEGKEVTEMNHGKVLGLTWNTDLGWTENIKEVVRKYGQKARGGRVIRGKKN